MSCSCSPPRVWVINCRNVQAKQMSPISETRLGRVTIQNVLDRPWIFISFISPSPFRFTVIGFKPVPVNLDLDRSRFLGSHQEKPTPTLQILDQIRQRPFAPCHADGDGRLEYLRCFVSLVDAKPRPHCIGFAEIQLGVGWVIAPSPTCPVFPTAVADQEAPPLRVTHLA